MSNSPVPPASQPSWAGHHRVTSQTLEGILQRARAGKSTPSLRERVLANVCELRRAAATGDWLEHRTTNCLGELVAACFALNEIGAQRLAANIMEALLRAKSAQGQEMLLLKLEHDLKADGPMLDSLIARYAQHLQDANRCADSLNGVVSATSGCGT